MTRILSFSDVENRSVLFADNVAFPVEVGALGLVRFAFAALVPREETWEVIAVGCALEYEFANGDLSLTGITASIRAIGGDEDVDDDYDAFDTPVPLSVSAVKTDSPARSSQFASLSLQGLRLIGGQQMRLNVEVSNSHATLARDVTQAHCRALVQPARMSPGRR